MEYLPTPFYRYPATESVRLFKVPPSLNLQAERIEDLSPLRLCETEPPLTKGYTTEEILRICEQPLDLGDVPCHTQSVERITPLVCTAARKSANLSSREGIVSNTICSRQKNPSLEHKGANNE